MQVKDAVRDRDGNKTDRRLDKDENPDQSVATRDALFADLFVIVVQFIEA